MILSAVLLFVSCEEDLQNNTGGTPEGGLVRTSNSALNYVVGNDGTYSFDLQVQQNPDYSVKEINIYKSAVIADSDSTQAISNEILQETVTVEGDKNIVLRSSEYSYADLTEGLTINGNALPASDGELNIGDRFIFRIESVMENGDKFQQNYEVEMTVSTRFAGKYVCTDLTYYRIGVESPSYWLGNELQIKSIDAITYEYGFGETIGWDGPLYLQIDADGNITYPEEWNGEAQTLNGQPVTTCDRNPGDLTNVACDGSNIVIKDDVNGADQLIMTYGYFTGGSGPREFKETLVKVVE